MFRTAREGTFRLINGVKAGLALTVGILLVASPSTSASSGEGRHAALVVDANSGAVLHERAADEPRYPASLTKVMTLYMVFELIEQGRLSYGNRIKISQEAASVAPSKLDLEPGEEIPLIDAIKATVTKSANDVAVAIAEHIAGTEANFARLMTAKARQLGMKKTTFRNASGLPDPEQVTTARDMVTLALRLQDQFPRHYALFATRRFTYNGSTYRNHNTLLTNFQGTDGIKTGYIRASGFNLVASVRRGNRHVVGAVFGGNTAAARNVEMRALLQRGLARATTKKTRKPLLVAEARPAPQPVRARRPQRETAAATAEQFPWTNPSASSALAPVRPLAQNVTKMVAAVESSSPAAAPPQLQPAPLKIEVARVRPVMVAPRVTPPGTRRANDDETSDMPAPISGLQPPRAPATPKSDSAGMPSPPPPPGRAPSTLQRQAEAMAPGASPPQTVALASKTVSPVVRTAAHSSTSGTPSGGRFQIQIGAYSSAEEAARRISAIAERAGSLLDGRAPLTIPVQNGTRQLYRARFAGFDANGAATTCQALRRLSIDCFVMKAE